MAVTSGAPATLGGHPKGLFLLFSVEMWERFSYYGMRALLVLYMVAQTSTGGFGWDSGTALKIYGYYTGLVYLTPLLGGYIADRWLGQRRAVTLGGVLMMFGHFLMAVPGEIAFFAALGLLILGNGFFKPNISTMVGGLYEQKDPRRDGAFTIFYMGINLGAFFSPLVCGTLGEKIGWHYGFAAAGVGMAFGLIAYLALQKKLLGNIGNAPTKLERSAAKAADAPLTKKEYDRIMVILILAFFTIFFWTAFEQAGGLMSLYTDTKVDRMLGTFQVPTSWFQSINPMLIVLLGPVFSIMWTRLGASGRNPSSPVKMALGLIILGVGFLFMLGAARQAEGTGKAAMYWVVMAYAFHTLGELCLSPVGLSMVTKLAPLKYASLLMGVWLLSSFVANLAAGYVGSYSEKLGEFQLFFSIFVATVAAGGFLLGLSRYLKKKMHGAEGGEDTAAEEPRAGLTPA